MQAGDSPRADQGRRSPGRRGQSPGPAAAGQVAAAQANVALIDEQIGPADDASARRRRGPDRAVEPGEVALPGGTLLMLGDLGHLTVTVYLPEDRYGAVKVGDTARVTVDSFPGQAFRGTVQRVADQAEFTPRNVQTTDGPAHDRFCGQGGSR